MAVALALFTSVAYGLSNYVGPRLARGAPLALLLLVGQSCALVLAGALVSARGEPLPDAGAIAFAVAAGLGNAGGLVFLYRAAAVGPLSVVIPIGALGASIPVVAGFASGEEIAVLKVAGIVLAIAGVVLVARRTAAQVAAVQPEGHDRRAAVVLAAASAVCFGIFLATLSPASDGDPGWAVFLSRASLVAALLAFAVHQGALRAIDRSRLPLLAVPGLLLFAGTLSYAAATQEGDLGVVSVLGSLFPVVTVALAVGIDGERLSRWQALGAGAVIVGVVLLSSR